MNYAKIRNYDIANGEGVRTSLFVSGCTNHCPGCFNPEERDFNCGRPFTKETIAEIHKMLPCLQRGNGKFGVVSR